MKLTNRSSNATKLAWLLLPTILILLCQPVLLQAVPSSALPNTSLLTSFAEFGNNLTESAVTITGNVGVSSGGTMNMLSVMAPSTINGNVFVATGASSSGPGTITGSTFLNQNLSANQAQVFSASSTMAGLSADQTISSTVTSGLSFSALAGNVIVINMNGGLNLNGGNIQFSGAGFLVLNITGQFQLTGTSSILASDPTHVFVNYTGTGNINTHVGDLIDGYIFDPNGTATFDGTFDGGIYGGNGNISLLSNANLENVPPAPTVPDAGSTALLLAMGAGAMGFARRGLQKRSA